MQSLLAFTSVVTVLHGGMEPPARETSTLLPKVYWSAPASKTSILVKYRTPLPLHSYRSGLGKAMKTRDQMKKLRCLQV